MSELGPEERALLNALRAADEPTEDDRTRMRAAVWARLGIAGAAAAATAASAAPAKAVGTVSAGAAVDAGGAAAAGAAAPTSAVLTKGAAITLLGAPLKIGIATVVVGLTTGAALYTSAQRGAPHAPDAATIAAAAAQTPRRAAGSEPASEAAPASGELVAAPVTPLAATAAPAAPAEPAARAPAARRPGAAPGAVPKPESEGLDAEVALLRDAQQAMQSGNFGRALSKLNEHAARYPTGVLATEREASRAIALCRSGRTASGRAIAAKLLARNAGSPLATRVRAACGQAE